MTATQESIDRCLEKACEALNEVAIQHKEAASPFGKDFLYKVGEALCASWEARQLLHAHHLELIPIAVLDQEEPGVYEHFLALLAQTQGKHLDQNQVTEAFASFIAAAPSGSYLRGIARLRARLLGLAT